LSLALTIVVTTGFTGSRVRTSSTGAVPASTQSGAASAQVTRLTVTATETASAYTLTPAALTVPAGQPVELTLLNKGASIHNWAAPDLATTGLQVLSMPKDLPAVFLQDVTTLIKAGHPILEAGPNQRAVIRFTPLVAGTYHTLCTIPGHKEMGMVGTLVVTGGRLKPDAVGGVRANAQGADTMSGMVMPDTGGASLAHVTHLPQPAVAPPLPHRPPTLVHVTMTAKEVTGYLADGKPYRFWTFNGSVPGPMIRVRQGDTVEVTLKNAPDSTVSHSIDFHAASGPDAGGDATQVAPGQSATFRFKALNPGVYLYHCMTMPVAEHIANGMYGLVVVEPPGGLPHVDREFYVVEGEIYLQGKQQSQAPPSFSMGHLLAAQPDYVVFNGAVGALQGSHALTAHVGDTVRIFYGMAGPNLAASLHIIGVIFDRVYQEGATEPAHNVGVTLVPAGGTTMVEFTVRAPGHYSLIDHSFARVLKGAMGTLTVSGPSHPSVFQVVRLAHTDTDAPASSVSAPGRIVIHNAPRTAVVGQAERFSVLLPGQSHATLTYILRYPDGHEERIPVRTDGQGYSSYTFRVSPYQARRFRETGTVGVADATGRVLASTHLAIQQRGSFPCVTPAQDGGPGDSLLHTC
jgi:nitrite reductase (NO-forming)